MFLNELHHLNPLSIAPFSRSSTFPPMQVQWLPWMHGLPQYVVDPEMKFSDIIVPTADTVRSSELLELLLKNNKTVCIKAF